MPDATQELMNMKKEIERAEAQRSRFQGQLDGLLARLQDEYQIGSLEEAEKALARMDKELAKKEAALEAKIQELKTKYPWGTI